MTQATTRVSAATLARRLGPPTGAAGQPAYRMLARQIRSAVLDGRLAVSTGLPSERELAAGLSLSRTTVAAAYAVLRDEGWLDSRRGSGSSIRLPGSAQPGVRRVAGVFGGLDAHLPPDGPPGDGPIDLTVASLPAPTDVLPKVLIEIAADVGQYAGQSGYHPLGLPALRQAIADRYTATGLPTTIDEILVTNGAQHAFTLALLELSVPGDRVMIECPTYPVALDAIRAARRTVGPVGASGFDRYGGSADSDDGAWDLDLIRAELRQTAPRLAYLIPDFQNPTGAVMSAEMREQLTHAARRSGTMLLVDESFRDVPFPGSPALPPQLATFGDSTRVLSLGSVSKSMWGGLRVGWIRAAAPLVRRLAAARALGDMAGPLIDQLIVTRLLADPEPIFDQQRTRLAAGAAAAHAMLAADLPDWQATTPGGGASLWVQLPGPIATELARLAPAAGVLIAPGTRFGPDGTMESYLRLPFTAPPDVLRAAGPRLAAAADQAIRTSGAGTLPGWLT